MDAWKRNLHASNARARTQTPVQKPAPRTAGTPPRQAKIKTSWEVVGRATTPASPWKTSVGQKMPQRYTQQKREATPKPILSTLDYKKYLEHRKQMIQMVTQAHTRPQSASRVQRPAGVFPRPRTSGAVPNGNRLQVISRNGWTAQKIVPIVSPDELESPSVDIDIGPRPSSAHKEDDNDDARLPDDAPRLPSRISTHDSTPETGIHGMGIMLHRAPVADTGDGKNNGDDIYLPPRPNTVSGMRPRPLSEQCLENYSMGKKIGEGAYAQVYYARHSGSSKKDCAVKVYDKYKLSDTCRRRSVMREIKILSRIHHPHIVGFHEAIDRTSKIYVVMEFCSGGSLFALLKKMTNRCCEEKVAVRLFHETASGIQYLHERSVVHRDIKLENVLLDENESIKIIDFGFATVIQPGKKLKAFCGTPSYMAPEIVARREYIPKAPDVWALGVLFFALLAGHFPFKGTNDRELYRRIMRGTYQIPSRSLPSTVSQQALRRMLDVDQVRRASVSDILKMDFGLVDVRWDSLHDSSTTSTRPNSSTTSTRTGASTHTIQSRSKEEAKQEEGIGKLSLCEGTDGVGQIVSVL